MQQIFVKVRKKPWGLDSSYYFSFDEVYPVLAIKSEGREIEFLLTDDNGQFAWIPSVCCRQTDPEAQNGYHDGEYWVEVKQDDYESPF